MKKTTKSYEAPVAELIEMQMPTVLMGSLSGESAEGENPLGL